jgi:hypothetical protein
MTGLHDKIKILATNGLLKMEALKPNSRQIAQRMIAEGKLIKSGSGYRWHELKK